MCVCVCVRESERENIGIYISITLSNMKLPYENNIRKTTRPRGMVKKINELIFNLINVNMKQ